MGLQCAGRDGTLFGHLDKTLCTVRDTPISFTCGTDRARAHHTVKGIDLKGAVEALWAMAVFDVLHVAESASVTIPRPIPFFKRPVLSFLPQS
jgi:hypothetical protein